MGEELAVGLRGFGMAVEQVQSNGTALQRGFAEGLALETFLEGLERLLRTIEDAWGLPRLGLSRTGTPIGGIWKR